MVDFNIARDKSERDERATTGKRRSIFNPRTKIGIEDREEERYDQRKVKQNGKNSRTRPHDSTSEGMEEEEKGVIE